MKYVAIDGGLGNQMFQYAFVEVLRSRGNKVKALQTNLKYEHKAGYELERVFGIKEEATIWTFLYNCKLKYIMRKLFHLSHKRYNGTHYRYQPDVLTVQGYSFYYGTWQCASYYEEIRKKLLLLFCFDPSKINYNTSKLLVKIRGLNTVSCHIRRGDYLSDTFKDSLGGCCNIEYYKRAIEYIQKKVDNPFFLFFSDDILWTRSNIKVKQAIYVDFNHDTDAWQDMYLMSKCNHNIIANSSFSWWGGYLNENKDKIVIAPKHWISFLEKDDVTPLNWVRM